LVYITTKTVAKTREAGLPMAFRPISISQSRLQPFTKTAHT